MSIRQHSFGPDRHGRVNRGSTPSLRRPNLRRYRVVLHRTPGRDLPSVVRTLRTVLRLADAEATYRMWESHRHGQTPIIITHLERAELYAEQIQADGLVATVEPLE
jgi:ATP-dependent Clp protease adaptor protein ClpS